jgi:hypothetical protein
VVAAVLRPEERTRVEAAGSGWFSLVLRESIPEAIRAVRERPVDAILVSVHQCGEHPLDMLGHLVRGFPGIPTVALVSRHDPQGSEALLHLGASGVRQVVDVTGPDGWHRLRQVLGQPTTRDAARIQGPVLVALGEVPPDARLFFEALIRLAPDVATARQLTDRLGVRCTTLMSRFARAGIPSPKSYLATMRLLHATLLFERPRPARHHEFRASAAVSIHRRPGAVHRVDDRALPRGLVGIASAGEPGWSGWGD